MDGKIDLTTKLGQIRVKNLKIGDGFRAETHAGRIDICNVASAEYFQIAGSIGPITLDFVFSDKIEVCTIGSVDCRRIQADAFITINTTTGTIKCSIEDESGNYTAHCHSAYGSCNLPDMSGNGRKTLRLNTDVGNINVRFKYAG